MKRLFFVISNLHTHYNLKLDLQKVDQYTGGKWHQTPWTISCKAWNSPVKYPSRKSEHNIKESEGNIFNPIIKGKVQRRKHSERCAFAEPELFRQKSKHVVQKKNKDHKNPNNSHIYRDEIEFYQGISKTHRDTQHLNNAHTKTRRIDYDGVQMTNAKCHIYPAMPCSHRATAIRIIVLCTPV